MLSRIGKFLCATILCAVGCQKAQPVMTRMEFSLTAPDLQVDSVGARPKTIYLAGKTCARIEQYADVSSDLKNLIIVREPEIWLVDIRRKTVGHSTNRSNDLTVHNPILGPDGPEDLIEFEYGHEVEFFNKAHTSHLGRKKWRGIECDVREVASGDYRFRLYRDRSTNLPVKIEALKNGAIMFDVQYLSYRNDILFDPSLFQPAADLTVVEASEQ